MLMTEIANHLQDMHIGPTKISNDVPQVSHPEVLSYNALHGYLEQLLCSHP